MKKNGFTLVELLCVILLLAGLITLVTVNIVNSTKSGEDILSDSTKQFLFTLSENYLVDNKSTADGNYTITVDQLIKKDYITETFLKGQKKEKITRDSCIKVNITNGKYNEEFKYTCD